MKTLKKTLCLVLAVVMAVGVLILPANAAGYDDMTDTDKINPNYAEAVETLTGMGIISGKASGTTTKFDPKGTLLRQEAAIMIVNVMMKSSQKKTELAGYADRFTDIAGTDVYARKEINYLAAKGIVSGKDTDAGLFKPHDTLTTYELLTMLRKVAEIKNGYVADAGEWTAQAMTFATDYNAFSVKDLDPLFADPNKTPTREEAAQLIFNVIKADTDTSATGTYTVTVYDLVDDEDDNGDPIQVPEFKDRYPGVSLEQALMLKVTYSDTAKYVVTIDADGIGGTSIGAQVYGLTRNTLRDPYGRPFLAWFNGKTDKNNAIYSDTQLSSVDYTDKNVTLEKIFIDDLDVDFHPTTKTINVTVYVDGVAQSATLKDDGTVTGDDINTLTGHGVEVSVYQLDDYVYNIIIVNTYVKKLPAAKNGKITIEANTDAKKVITVSSEDYAKGDIVLYTKGVYSYGAKVGYTVADVTLATPVEGHVTNINRADNYFRLNGEVTKYYVAEKADTFTVSLTPANANAVRYWVDARNNVYTVDDAAPDEAPDYIYVVHYDHQVPGTQGNDLFEDTTAVTTAGARIKYFDLATGKVAVADLSVVSGTGDDVGKWFLADENGYGVDEISSTNEDTYTDKYDGKFVSVTKTSGGLVLGEVDDDYDKDLTTELKLTKGNAVVEIGSDKYYANANTNLVLIKNTNGVLTSTSLKGYKNFVNVNKSSESVNYTSEKVLVVTNRNDDTIVTDIYVIYSVSTGTTTTPANYALYLGAGEQSSEGYSYNFLVDGKVVSYISQGVQDALTATNVRKLVELYFSTTTGKLTNATLKEDDKAISVTAETVHAVDDTTIVIGSNQYSLSSNVVVLDASGATATLETTFADALAALVAEDSELTMKVYCLGTGSNAATTITLVVVE